MKRLCILFALWANLSHALAPQEQEANYYLGFAGKSPAFVNLTSGEPMKIIPEGYKVVYVFGRSSNEEMLLHKNRRIYAFTTAKKKLSDLTALFPELKYESEKTISIVSSFSESGVYFVSLKDKDFILNTSKATFSSIRKIGFPESTDHYFDSKNERFFVHAAGDGIGSTTPLKIVNMKGIVLSELIPESAFGMHNPRLTFAYPYFNLFDWKNPKQAPPEKLFFIDAREKNLTVEEFTLSSAVKSTLLDFSYASIVIRKDLNTVAFGGSDRVYLARLRGNELFETHLIPIDDCYLYSPYLVGTTMYFVRGKSIEAIDLKDWKRLPSKLMKTKGPGGYPLGLFYLPENT